MGLGATRAIVLLALVPIGCAGEPSQNGASEAFRVRNAQFVRAKLPGKPPKKGSSSAASAADAGTKGPPRITARNSMNNALVQGQGGKVISGRATQNSIAIAASLDKISSGYWVVPTDVIDTATNELTWSITADFDRSIEPGSYRLLFAPIGDDNVVGEQLALTLCVDSRVPDNLKVCDPKQALPRAVISLSWDANVDLDLQVIDPDGHVIDTKMPSTEQPDGGVFSDEAGVIDRDSNANCAIDGINTENLVWDKVAPSGLYRIYANLFDACKQPAVRFRLGIYMAEDDGKGGERFKLKAENSGELLDIAANGGSARGLFVREFRFP